MNLLSRLASDPNSLNQCDIDKGENAKKSSRNYVYYTYPEVHEIVAITIDEFTIKAGLVIFALTIIFCDLRSLCWKCRKVVYVKENVKYK